VNGSLGRATALSTGYRDTLAILVKWQCTDGIDNDGDGLVDYPDDPGCASAGNNTETAACQDGIDNDGDGKIDFDGGASANHGTPLGPIDEACALPYATTEITQCDDGIDNDGDGFVDFADPNCSPAWPYWETAPRCGLGAELALVVPLLGLATRRRRRAR